MLLTEDAGIGSYHIRAYDSESVTINDRLYYTSIIVSPYKLITDWEPKTLDDLKPKDIDTLLSLSPEVVILGTGKKYIFPPKEKLEAFLINRIGVESMDTGAACRTYTALISEGRKVVAALIINNL